MKALRTILRIGTGKRGESASGGTATNGATRDTVKNTPISATLKTQNRKRKTSDGSASHSPGSPKKRRLRSPREVEQDIVPRRSARLQRQSPKSTQELRRYSPPRTKSRSPGRICSKTPKLPHTSNSLTTRSSQQHQLPSNGGMLRNNSGTTERTEELSSVSTMDQETAPFDMRMGTEIRCRWERTGQSTVRGHAFSITGSLKEKNQDWCSINVQDKFAGVEPHCVFTVCDGHGILGHMSSRHCARTIPNAFSLGLAGGRTIKNAMENAIDNAHKELVEYSQYNTGMMQLIFKRMASMETARQLDYGTTAVIGHIAGNQVTIGNIGDSRAVLLTAENGVLRCRQLTQDHNPTVRKDEVARIQQAGGRVTNTGQELRISPSHLTFLESRRNGLTINMSRAVGHDLLRHAGVTALPEFSTTTIDRSKTSFIVAGSDGIFDVLSNAVVTRIVGEVWRQHSDSMPECMERAMCVALIEKAEEEWRRSRGDNITAMVLHFPPEPAN